MLRRESAFAKDFAGADDRILRVGPGLSFEAQRLLEVEGDHRAFGELEHEIAQRANRDLHGNIATLAFRHLGIPGVDFLLRRRDQGIDQVIGLHAKALAARDLDERPFPILWRDFVAELFGTTRGKDDKSVREMMLIFSLLGITEATQCLNDIVLRVFLAKINHIVDGMHAAKMRMAWLARFG